MFLFFFFFFHVPFFYSLFFIFIRYSLFLFPFSFLFFFYTDDQQFFSDLSLERQMGNIECNMLASVKLTHHFLNNMLEKKLKGAIVFTSSPAGITDC